MKDTKDLLADIAEAQKNLTSAADRLKVGVNNDVIKSLRLAEILTWKARHSADALTGSSPTTEE